MIINYTKEDEKEDRITQTLKKPYTTIKHCVEEMQINFRVKRCCLKILFGRLPETSITELVNENWTK